MDYRQRVADAAVVELRHQLGAESVDQDGTHVQVDGGFKMARLAEAIIRVSVDDLDPIIDEVAKTISPRPDEWESYRDTAVDAIAAVRGAILAMLDPLP